MERRIEGRRRSSHGEFPAIQGISGEERTVRHLHRRSQYRALQAELRGRLVQLPADRHDRVVSPATRLQSPHRASRTPLRPVLNRSPRGLRFFMLSI